MKIALMSDLHLECGSLDVSNKENADVLILSGDICEARNTGKFLPFFTACSNAFKHVLYVLGNHEFYGDEYEEAKVKIRNTLQHLTNISILDNQHKIIDDVLFIGSTLWTDFNKEDPISMWQSGRVMNDYGLIRVKHEEDGEIISRRLQPQDTLKMHYNSKQYVKDALIAHLKQKTVVVTHHCPTAKSVHAKYQRDVHVNGAFFSNQEEIMRVYPQIALWTHGHTHEKFDYEVFNTRVVCNPRGYAGYEETSVNYEAKLIEI